MLEAIAAAVEGTPFALWAARHPLAYPLANVVHVLGLVLLLGGIGLVDLRLMGLFRALPLVALSQALTPLGIGGLCLLAASGSVLFAADATSLAGSPIFRWKLVLIALALTNALLFRLLWKPSETAAGWGRAMALASLCLWLSVAVLGRWIAYG